MTLEQLCAAVLVEKNTDKFSALCADIRLALSPGQREQLQQLINSGPAWDGDVISKTTRDELVRLRLAARVLVKGNWGYTAATYLGGNVMDASVHGVQS